MSIKFSPSTRGFYEESINGDNIPADAIEITEQDRANLLAAESVLKVIIAGEDGVPVAVEKDLQPVPVPTVVDNRQARRALLEAGKLAEVEAAIAGMPGIEGERARIDWEFAGTVERDSPLVQHLAGAIGLDGAQIDLLFRQAAQF